MQRTGGPVTLALDLVKRFRACGVMFGESWGYASYPRRISHTKNTFLNVQYIPLEFAAKITVKIVTRIKPPKFVGFFVFYK